MYAQRRLLSASALFTLAACSASIAGSTVPTERDAAAQPEVPVLEAGLEEASIFPPDAAAVDDGDVAIPGNEDVPVDVALDVAIADVDVPSVPDADDSSSVLIVSQVILPVEPLTGRPQTVMRLHFASSGARPVALKRFGYLIEAFDATRDALASSVNLLNADGPLPVQVYADPSPSTQTLRVAAVFHDERIVDRAGFDADLVVGLNREAVPGDRLRISAQIQPGPVFGSGRRGALTPVLLVGWSAGMPHGPHVYDGELPCRTFRLPVQPDLGNTSSGFFVWSPMTDPRHSDRDCASGGSSDWINGAAFPSGMFSPTYVAELSR